MYRTVQPQGTVFTLYIVLYALYTVYTRCVQRTSVHGVHCVCDSTCCTKPHRPHCLGSLLQGFLRNRGGGRGALGSCLGGGGHQNKNEGGGGTRKKNRGGGVQQSMDSRKKINLLWYTVFSFLSQEFFYIFFLTIVEMKGDFLSKHFSYILKKNRI